MKIDSDLRAAIRAAEASQKSIGWEEKERIQRDALNAFLSSKPVIGKQVKKLCATSDRHRKIAKEAEETLCKKFGLQQRGIHLIPATCSNGEKKLYRLGFKKPNSDVKWSFNAVMVELAAADPKNSARILKKYGINWK